MQEQAHQLSSSYRDPSGYVFTYENEIYRHVSKSFQKDFEHFINSGLYQFLIDKKHLIPHQVIAANFTGDDGWFTTLKPEVVEVISYPYEWSFSMLKDAALLTLDLAVIALSYGMMLKDASPYNVQWHKGQLVFIDTLSFEIYKEGEPWIAYRQFCESFVAPLALMHYSGLPLQQLLLAYPNGIPLLYAKKLLPFKSRFNIHLYLHVHLHAAAGARRPKVAEQKPFLSKQKLLTLLKSLKDLVNSFHLQDFKNIWGAYYEEAETRPLYLDEKKHIISGWLQGLPTVQSVVDIGGNNGEFSFIAAAENRRVICADGEHHAIETLYHRLKKEGISSIVPLHIDFTSPSPSIGVNNTERSSFLERASSDLAMALAFIHHLAIGKNVSFELIAEMCARLGKMLIIEFVKKEDDKVRLLLQHKKDIYNWYTQEKFEQAFSRHFKTIEKRELSSSPRTLYLMERL